MNPEKMNNVDLLLALTKAQKEIRPPVKDKLNPRFKSRYASLDAIYDACRLPLANHGLTLSHSVEDTSGKFFLRTTLSHISGQTLENAFPLFIEQQNSQGLGSALTYGRRYAICSLLALPADEDDDGESSDKESPKALKLSHEQMREIEGLLKDDEDLRSRILKGYGVERLSDINSTEFGPMVFKIKKIKGGS